MPVTYSQPRRISQPGIPAVHTYYDFAPESPDGSRVLYSQFKDGIPGPARLVLAQRDGSDARCIATTSGQCIGHTGGFGLWLDNDTIAYQSQDSYFGTRPTIHVHNLQSGQKDTVDGKLRAYTPVTQRGLMFEDNDPQMGETGNDQIHLWNRASGAVTPLLTTEDTYAIHPTLKNDNAVEQTHFMNTKWHPDGRTFMFVYTNHQRRKAGQASIKSLMIADADTGDCRYLCEFGDHHLWSPAGDAILCHDREDGQRTLVRIDPATGEKQTLIKPYVGGHSTPNLAGTHVITDVIHREQEPVQSEVLLYDLATRQYTTLASGAHGKSHHVDGTHVHPAFSADASRIYFNSGRDGEPAVYVMDIDFDA